MLNRCTAVLVLLCVASACGQTETRHAEQVRLRGLQVTPPNGTSLSASEYEGLLGLLGGNGATRLISLYRTSVHGTTYGDLLDNVGDTKPLVFVVRKDKYVFGAFISEGIQLPDDPTSSHVYDSDVGSHWPALTGRPLPQADQDLCESVCEGAGEGGDDR